MKKFRLGVVAFVALAAAVPALAADLPVRTYTKAPAYAAAPIYNWTGFYIGMGGKVLNPVTETITEFTINQPITPFFPAEVRVAQNNDAQRQISNSAAIDYNWTISPTNLLEFR